MSKKTNGTVAEVLTVKPSTAKVMINVCMNSNLPVMLWGPPGIGKSDIIRQIAASTEKKDEDGNVVVRARKVIDMRLLLLDPTDIRGIPYFDSNEGRMKWAQSSDLPEIVTMDDIKHIREKIDSVTDELENREVEFENAKNNSVHHVQAALYPIIDKLKSTIDQLNSDLARHEGAFDFQNAILFLDELVGAPQSVQGAAYQLILDRKVGEYTLPAGVNIIAAGNRATDRAIVHPMPKPLQNRFVHLNLDVDFSDWQSWAINNNISPSVVGYLSASPQHLFDFDPKSQSMAFSTPRSWKFVSEIINKNKNMTIEMLHPIIAGTIGDGGAIEFINHLKMAADLPNPMNILTGKEKKMKSKEISVKYSLTISLCYLLKSIHDNAKYNAANNIVAAKGTSQEDIKYATMDQFNEYMDNFFKFMLDNFEEEMCVLGSKTVLSNYKLIFDHHKVKQFTTFVERFGDMIIDC